MTQANNDRERVIGYCMRCGENGREMRVTERTVAKNGRPMTKGNCVECGSRMSRFG